VTTPHVSVMYERKGTGVVLKARAVWMVVAAAVENAISQPIATNPAIPSISFTYV
jgi:hypothetical protein